jgi:phospholipid/cholesterol/gamma-HCH transport system substrate-binding protein
VQWLNRLQDFSIREDVAPRTQAMWAIGAAIVLVVVTAATSMLYLHPPGRTQVYAQMTESGGISTGTEVRIAGIPVGKVSAVDLRDHHVDVTLDVEDTVFLGDQTSLDVRMLTVVGGAYVALVPAGAQPLGDDTIPAERTSVPYSTAEVLDQAAGLSTQIDATTMRDTTVAVTDMLDSEPGAVRGIVANVADLTELLDRQQAQLTSLADLGAEYTTELAGQRDALREMIRRVRATLPVMVGYKDRGLVTFDALSRLVLYMGDIFDEPYTQRFQGLLDEAGNSGEALGELTADMNDAIAQVRALVDRVAAVVDPQGVSMDLGDRVVEGSSVCIPIAGRAC